MQSQKPKAPRRGAVLLLVLVVVPALALGAYAFTQWMRAEALASRVVVRQTKARLAAESGIELVRALLADPFNLEPGQLDLYDNPVEFAGLGVFEEDNGTVGMVSLISSVEDGSASNIRYGLVNESAKIPLHNSKLYKEAKKDWLMALPNMTIPLVKAILDWIDSNSNVRIDGAEKEYYLMLDPPYEPTNGTPLTLGDLLLVRDVTPDLLYGEDVNLNGLLDPNEDDGYESWPPDNADGILERGWYPYLTIHSAAANTNPAGEPKLGLNGSGQTNESENDDSDDLLLGRLAELFGEEFVFFFEAYRKENKKIESVSKLIDAKVTIEESDPKNNGKKKKSELYSPWTQENLDEFLETALEELTIHSKSSVSGLIDITDAPREVLMSLPEMTEELADRIASAAQNRTTIETTPAWLLLEGIVDLEEFEEIEPYITTQGRVFRVDAVGFFSDGGPVARMQAILDVSGVSPRVIWKRDLTPLGTGYPLDLLLQAVGSRQ